MESAGLWANRSGQYGQEDTESEYLLKAREEENGHSSKREYKEASTARKVLVQISCMMQLFVSLGIGYSLSVMYAEIVIVFDSDRTYASLIQSLFMGINVAFGILFAFIIKKTGPGIAIFVGACVAWLGLFASSFANDIAMIIVCTGVVAGMGAGLCQFAAFLTVGWLFHNDPGIFLIMLTFGISFGQLLMPSLCEIFISGYSWSGAFILLSGVIIQCIPFGLIIHLSKRYYVMEKKQSKGGKSQACCDVTLFADAVLWIIWTNAFFLGQTGNIEPLFIVDHMITRGFSRTEGATAVSVIGGGNVFGKLIGVCLKFGCKKIPTIYHWIYSFLILAILHGVIAFLYDVWALMISCALFGCVVGLLWSQLATIAFEASDLDKYPQAFAVINLMIGLGNLVGATSGGYIKDTYGVYDINFFIGVAASVYMSLSTFVAAFIIRRRAKT